MTTEEAMEIFDEEYDVHHDGELVTTTRYALKNTIRTLLDQQQADFKAMVEKHKHTMAHIEGAKRVEQDYVFVADLLTELSEREKEV